MAVATNRRVILRGVSLEPSVDGGIRHMARAGVFDEVSLGGNWTNSSAVRYLGSDMSDTSRAAIPQVILLEREVRRDGGRGLVVGPEHEIGRYIGIDKINSWLEHGAPLAR